MCSVLMEPIDDVIVGMKHQIVGVPRTWVNLFKCLLNVTVFYDRAHKPQA
jgi:hypothetical protein